MGDSNPFSGLQQLGEDLGNRIGGEIGSVIKNPTRAILGFQTGGLSEAGFAAKDILIDQPKAAAEKAAGQAKKIANDARLAAEEDERKTDLTKKRDEERLKQRSLSLADQGRAGTILTGNSLGNAAQTKTILGS